MARTKGDNQGGMNQTPTCRTFRSGPSVTEQSRPAAPSFIVPFLIAVRSAGVTQRYPRDQGITLEVVDESSS